MSLQLVKTGSSLPLTKADGQPSTKFVVELSWNANGPKAPYDFDVIAAATSGGVVGQGLGKTPSTANFCYWGQKQTPGISLSGDNRDGQGDGVDEALTIDLTQLPAGVNQIPVVIEIHQAAARGQDMSQTKGATAVIRDVSTGAALAQVNLDTFGVGTTAVLMATIEVTGQTAKVHAVNQGFVGKDLNDFVQLLTA